MEGLWGKCSSSLISPHPQPQRALPLNALGHKRWRLRVRATFMNVPPPPPSSIHAPSLKLVQGGRVEMDGME
eukprot:2703769-Amphidinium_carterae.1